MKLTFLNVIICLSVTINLTSALEVKCKFTNSLDKESEDEYYPDSVSPENFKHYHCKVIKLKDLDYLEFVSIITGQHLRGYKEKDVESVQISSHSRKLMPIGFTKFFPNLEAFHMEKSGISSLQKYDLYEFRKLQVLLLNDNKLVALDIGLFEFTPKLRHVNFERNKLIHIDALVFDGLPNLTKVSIGNNICLGECGPFNAMMIGNRLSEILLQKCQNSNYIQYLKDKRRLSINAEFLGDIRKIEQHFKDILKDESSVTEES